MNKITLILKGILLYITIITIAVVLSSIDSLFENNYLIGSILMCLTLVAICIKFISKRDLERLTTSYKDYKF